MESLTKQVSFQEKEGSTVGQRVRAVGMVFYGNDDLTVGKVYGLRRNKANPKDKNCLEVIDQFRKPKAVINRDVSALISPLVDNNKIVYAEW